jgi:hypothetical protein
MVLAEPAVKALRILESTDLGGIDLDGRHRLSA